MLPIAARQCAGRKRGLGQGPASIWRIAMELSRRDLALAGVLALGATTLVGPALAEAGDEAAVKKAIDEFRQATISQDKAKLESLLADQLSYGHSSAKVDTKASIIDSTMTRKSK